MGMSVGVGVGFGFGVGAGVGAPLRGLLRRRRDARLWVIRTISGTLLLIRQPASDRAEGAVMRKTPATTIDLFSDDALADPYPLYQQLRDTGPAVHLEREERWAISRHADVRTVLTTPKLFASGDAVALTDHANEHMLSGTVLGTDGAEHRRLRAPFTAQLSHRALAAAAPRIESRAAQLTDSYVARGSFDGAELVTAFGTEVVLDLMGLPDGARRLLTEDPPAIFNAFGPSGPRHADGLSRNAAMYAELAEIVRPGTVRPGSFLSGLFANADSGRISPGDIVPLAHGYATAGVHTTLLALTTTLHLLSEHPDQWEHLRAERATADQAFAEALRLEAPVQAFGRRVIADTALGATQLRAGDKLWVLYGSAGRDRRHWGPSGDEFRIRRTGHGGSHLAFGAGAHTCAGLHLAHLQARALINALVARCRLIRPHGTPVRMLNNLLRGFSHLPLTVEPA